VRRFPPEAVPAAAALLVVDLQRGFMSEETRAAPAAIGRFLDRYGDRFRLVIASRFRNTEDCPTRLLLDSDSVSSDEEAELCDELRRPGVQVLEKTTYALGAPLAALLRRHAVEQLFICGVDTHACVLHEALDAFDRCIRPVVLADLCASGDGGEAHAAALAVLRRAIGVHNVWTLDG
jgi:nicotinamidase-related amidase